MADYDDQAEDTGTNWWDIDMGSDPSFEYDIPDDMIPVELGDGTVYYIQGTYSPDGELVYSDYTETVGGVPITYNEDGTVDASASAANIVSRLGSGAWNTLKNTFTKADGSLNWAALGTAAAGLYGMMGGNKVQTGGYSKPVPQMTAVRQAVPYTPDPNRVPGSAGRRYFSDTTFVPQGGDVAAAQAAAQTQAQGLAALPQAQQPTQAPVPATPATWNKPATQMAEGGKVPEFQGHLESGGFVMNGASVRGAGNGDREQGLKALHQSLGAQAIRGPGTETSDSIPTTIDGQQPAAVANGEAYVPRDKVAQVGGGSVERGADKLMKMMDRLREQAPKKSTVRSTEDEAGVRRFVEGAQVPAVSTTGYGSSSMNTLSPWVGDYVTGALGQGAAMAATPYQAYQGPLTAGAAPLQQQAFAGISGLAQAGYTPEQYKTQGFGTEQAQQYMNPYLSAALQPTLTEMQRQAAITRMGDAARLTKAGAFGGSRQAIMESEGNRNLLDAQRRAIAEGYSTAYDKGLGQFNTEQTKALEAQKMGEASRQYGAQFGLQSLGALGEFGQQQRGITAEGIAADKAQFEEERDWGYKMPQYQLGLLSGLPIAGQSSQPNTTGLSSLQQNISDLLGLYKSLSGVTPPTTTTTPNTSSAAASAVK